MHKVILNPLKKYLEGNILKHKANVEIYLKNSIGIGEHSDILETIEIELERMANYNDKLEMLNKYFNEEDTTEILND